MPNCVPRRPSQDLNLMLKLRQSPCPLYLPFSQTPQRPVYPDAMQFESWQATQNQQLHMLLVRATMQNKICLHFSERPATQDTALNNADACTPGCMMCCDGWHMLISLAEYMEK